MIPIAFLVAYCVSTALAISLAIGSPVGSWWITSLVILMMSLVFLFAVDRMERWLEGRKRQRITEARMSPDSFFGASGGIRLNTTAPEAGPSEPRPPEEDRAVRKSA